MQPVRKWGLEDIMQGLLYVLQLCYFTECTRTDVRTGYISVRFSLLCAVCGFFIRIIGSFAENKGSLGAVVVMLPEMLMDVAIGIFAMAAVFFCRNAVGMGDAWMIFVTGILCGRAGAIRILWLALMIGGIYGAFCICIRKESKAYAFPFAPCLLAAYMIRGCT